MQKEDERTICNHLRGLSNKDRSLDGIQITAVMPPASGISR